MSNPIRNDHRHAVCEARSALEIIHAQYHRALTRAARSESAERAGALAEARRLLGVAVAVRRRARARDADRIAAAAAAQSATSTFSVDREDMAVSAESYERVRV
jgi:hypothetical protein